MSEKELLAQVLDVMRRADPAFCELHQLEQTSDAEWDFVLQLLDAHVFPSKQAA